ncbi:AhpC/TSA family protein [Mucilaginibacter gracilis]|uniref:AhpC/TSA family protein n=1 Tax=Mucilaginibacter gracilis TaxID=423350 RepID=A0A495IZV4_9SPHI|nr:TlpA disulfide reductase family protein [Mucilaginibacter gracilis]RKR82053.1 AhpC/TSA family protein [Mucilaginibacter gracilis]
MHQNKIFFLLFFFAALQVNGQKISKVSLFGTLKNFDRQVEIEDQSAISDIKNSPTGLIISTDSAGRFSITFNLYEPNYYRIGRNILYLSPGDSLYMLIDHKKHADAVFKGTHSEENNFLKNTLFPKAGSFLESGTHIKPTVQQTIDYIINAADQKENELQNYKNISPKFRALEMGRIRADVIRSITFIRFYYPSIHKIPVDSLKKFDEEFRSVANPYINKYAKDFINPAFLDLAVYRNVIEYIVDNNNENTPGYEQITDYVKAKNVYKTMVNLKDKDKIKSYISSINEIKNPTYREIEKNVYNNLLAFGNGDSAINFSARNLKGEPVNLNDFRGKVIVVDFWATWCIPCLEELKYWVALVDKYKDDPNVVLIGVSIDDDKKKWKTYVNNHKLPGIQVLLNRSSIPSYSVKEIPRTVFINKNFIISEIRGTLPSNKKTVEYIETLLHKNNSIATE